MNTYDDFFGRFSPQLTVFSYSIVWFRSCVKNTKNTFATFMSGSIDDTETCSNATKALSFFRRVRPDPRNLLFNMTTSYPLRTTNSSRLSTHWITTINVNSPLFRHVYHWRKNVTASFPNQNSTFVCAWQIFHPIHLLPQQQYVSLLCLCFVNNNLIFFFNFFDNSPSSRGTQIFFQMPMLFCVSKTCRWHRKCKLFVNVTHVFFELFTDLAMWEKICSLSHHCRNYVKSVH